jgi:uncharacterized protein
MHARPTPTALPLTCTGAGEASPLRPERLIDGEPSPVAWNLYADATGQFFAGQWAAGPGRWHVAYEPHEEEFCVLLEGSVELTDRAGVARRFVSGDAFVVPGGFEGIWHNLTPVRKHYAIMNLQHSDSTSST